MPPQIPPCFYVCSVGLGAPGMETWSAAQSILRGESAWQSSAFIPNKPQRLPPNERRRATESVSLAFHICEDALTSIPEEKRTVDIATVFASSGGGYDVLDRLCRVLATSALEVSPTAFHNSVHNAAAGYWSIGTACMKPSTSLAAHDSSFAAGLLEAVMLLDDDQRTLLLAVYDTVPPTPLHEKCHINIPFGCALLLTRESSRFPALASCHVTIVDQTSPTNCQNEALEILRTQNPAAKCLPILEMLAKRKSGRVMVELPGTRSLAIDITRAARNGH